MVHAAACRVPRGRLVIADQAAAALAAVERAAEALDAEVAAIVCGGTVVSAVGYPEGAAPVGELQSIQPDAGRGELAIPGAGPCPATAVSLEHPPGATFVLARSGPDGLSREEIGLLRGMARIASMTMRILHVLDDERAARGQVERLVEEQTALRRVATLVARGVPPADVLSAVAEEVGRLLGADATIMLRFDSDDTATIVAALGVQGEEMPPGSRWTIEPSMAMAAIVRTGRSARIDDYSDVAGALPDVLRRQGVCSAVATPILVEGRFGARSASGPGANRSAPTSSGGWRPSPSSSRRRSRTRRRSTEVRRLADEQTALRRVADTGRARVASGAHPRSGRRGTGTAPARRLRDADPLRGRRHRHRARELGQARRRRPGR